MSAQKPFDYALARNNIVKLREIRLALETELDGAHMDIADLREQLARAERERDEARHFQTLHAKQCDTISTLTAQLAEAKREAFCAGWNDFAKVAKDYGLIEIPYADERGAHNWHIRGIGPLERFAKLYPAPSASAPEGTGECSHGRTIVLGCRSCEALLESVREQVRNKFGSTPAPEPPQEVVVPVLYRNRATNTIEKSASHIVLTPALAAQIVAMARAQEPTR